MPQWPACLLIAASLAGARNPQEDAASPGPAAWRAAAHRLAAESSSEDVPRLLEELTQLPPQEAMVQRQALMQARFRGDLLAACQTPLRAAAADLLVETFRRRLPDARSFSDTIRSSREAAHVVEPPGCRLVVDLPPGHGLELAELLLSLRDAELLPASLVVAPASLARFAPPLEEGLLAVPAGWFLRQVLREHRLEVVNLLWGLWVVPAEWLVGWPEVMPQHQSEWGRWLAERECEFLARGLLEPTDTLDAAARQFAQVAMLSALGLPLLPGTCPGGALEADAQLVAVAERWQGASRPLHRVASEDPWRRAWQRRAVVVAPDGGTDSPDLLWFDRAQRDPGLALRRAAEWLDAPAREPPSLLAARGLKVACLQNPAAALRHMARGTLGLADAQHMIRLLGAERAREVVTNLPPGRDGGFRRRVLLAWCENAAGEGDAGGPDAAQVLSAALEIADPPGPGPVFAALGDAEQGPAVAEILALDPGHALSLELLDWILEHGNGEVARRWLRVVATRVDRDPLLVGRCRNRVLDFAASAAEGDGWHGDLASSLWLLGKAGEGEWIRVIGGSTLLP